MKGSIPGIYNVTRRGNCTRHVADPNDPKKALCGAALYLSEAQIFLPSEIECSRCRRLAHTIITAPVTTPAPEAP